MKLLSFVTFSTAAQAVYTACSGKAGNKQCCSTEVLGFGLDCRAVTDILKDYNDFSRKCQGDTPLCCKGSLIGLAQFGCVAPAEDKEEPKPPAYNPCPNSVNPAARCCKVGLDGTPFCDKEEPMPGPTDLDNFKSICKADQKKRAYCCRIDEEGTTFACESPKPPQS